MEGLKIEIELEDGAEQQFQEIEIEFKDGTCRPLIWENLRNRAIIDG